MVEIARKLELGLELQDVNELLESHDKTGNSEKLLLVGEQRK